MRSLWYDFALLKHVSCLFIVDRMLFVIDVVRLFEIVIVLVVHEVQQ
jgi:hypothetical protein